MILLAAVAGVLVVLFLGVALIGAPYVPSKKRDIRRAFDELYPLDASEYIVDIGSGDGVVLREAAVRGARGLGYEINPLLVFVAWWLSRRHKNIRFQCANFWYVSFPAETTVVYTFGESRDIRRMAAKVELEATRMQKVLWFISYGADDPTRTAIKKVGAHYLYKVEPLQE